MQKTTARSPSRLRPHQVGRLQRALDLLETQPGRRLTLPEIARSAALAPHYFHRLFARLTGENVQAHARRLRLERAAFELIISRASVAEVAQRCGYTSPAAFARAFSGQFASSPRRFRREHPAGRFDPAIRPELRHAFERLQPELRDEPEKRLKAIRRPGRLGGAAHEGHAIVERLLAARSGDAEIYGRTPDFPQVTPPDQLRVDTAFACGWAHAPSDELAEQTLPGGRYAIFHLETGAEGRDAIVPLWEYAYFVWAPRRRMRLRAFGAYELYRRRAGRAVRVEVHVPLEPVEGTTALR